MFCNPDGEPVAPSRVPGAWRDAIDRLRKPAPTTLQRPPSFRGCGSMTSWHTDASALIAGGLDAVAIGRRLGHASPLVTLSVHAHLFKKSDEGAAAAIEAAMRTGAEQ